MGYINGTERSQQTMFPDTLDDYVEDNNTVRGVAAFVEYLNFREKRRRASASWTR